MYFDFLRDCVGRRSYHIALPLIRFATFGPPTVERRRASRNPHFSTSYLT
jgi:hypothetical protein